MRVQTLPEVDHNNMTAETMWFERLLLAVMNRFSIDGCERYGIDETYFKRWLLIEGRMGIFWDNDEATVAKINLWGMFNKYNLPTDRLLCAPNGYIWERDEHDSTVVWLTNNRMGIFPYLDYYSKKIARCEEIERINIEAQKTPYVMNVSPETARELKRMWEDLSDCSDLVVTSQKVTDKFEAFNLGVPWVAQQISDLKHVYLNDFYTLFGINNSSIEKRAQIQTAEINSNNQEVSLYGYAMEKSIRDGLREAQKKLGIELYFKWNDVAELPNATINTNLNVTNSQSSRTSDVNVDKKGGND